MLAEIQTEHVKNYLLTLHWQWQCRACQKTMPFDPAQRTAPKVCDYCQAIRSLIQVKRYTQGTISNDRGILRVFFDWARVNRLVLANPIRREYAKTHHTIQHYPLEILEKLCAAIVHPETDPRKALALYLILFHGFSAPELQRAEIPSMRTWPDGHSVTTLTETYAVVVPRSTVSVGVRSPRRPDVLVTFPQEAAGWLKPLLARFEHQRQRLLKNPQNGYLFLSSSTAHAKRPVSRRFLIEMIQDISQHTVGAKCSPGMLRKTAGILFADTAGAGVLRWMGWEDQQAFRYSWAQREIIEPRQLEGAGEQSKQERKSFPSPAQKGQFS